MSLVLSQTEENYLKAVFSLSTDTAPVNTNQIADRLQTKASSVTDMLQKLADKKLVDYTKYQGASLTKSGRKIAVRIIRKHRLWEVFLVKHLEFNWDEVHEVAEQLEHIRSNKLTDKLDQFLKYPTHDPHGDPIPDSEGNIGPSTDVMLSAVDKNEECVVTGVKDSSSSFLKYLDNTNIHLGCTITVRNKENFDNSMYVDVNGKSLSLSNDVSKNLFVQIV